MSAGGWNKKKRKKRKGKEKEKKLKEAVDDSVWIDIGCCIKQSAEKKARERGGGRFKVRNKIDRKTHRQTETDTYR